MPLLTAAPSILQWWSFRAPILCYAPSGRLISTRGQYILLLFSKGDFFVNICRMQTGRVVGAHLLYTLPFTTQFTLLRRLFPITIRSVHSLVLAIK